MPKKKNGAPKHYRPRPKTLCDNCGNEMVLRSNAKPGDPHFCGRLDCRNARSKFHRDKKREEREVRLRPGNCSNCGKALQTHTLNKDGTITPHPWTTYDTLGRWCKTPSCRAARDRVIGEAKQRIDALEHARVMENTAMMLSAALAADSEREHFIGRITCPECGNDQALDGWRHRNRQQEPCGGTLNGMEIRRVVPWAVDVAHPLPKFRNLEES